MVPVVARANEYEAGNMPAAAPSSGTIYSDPVVLRSEAL